jgi:Ca2+/H+ antiporter
MIAGDVYTFVREHRLSWDSVVGTILFLAFVVLYFRHARWTWVIMLLLAVRCLASVPSAYLRMPAHASVGTRIFAAIFMLVLALFGFVVTVIIRKRFENSPRTI